MMFKTTHSLMRIYAKLLGWQVNSMVIRYLQSKSQSQLHISSIEKLEYEIKPEQKRDFPVQNSVSDIKRQRVRMVPYKHISRLSLNQIDQSMYMIGSNDIVPLAKCRHSMRSKQINLEMPYQKSSNIRYSLCSQNGWNRKKSAHNIKIE